MVLASVCILPNVLGRLLSLVSSLVYGSMGVSLGLLHVCVVRHIMMVDSTNRPQPPTYSRLRPSACLGTVQPNRELADFHTCSGDRANRVMYRIMT